MHRPVSLSTIALGLAAVVAFVCGVSLDLFWLRMLSKPVPVLLMALAVAGQAKDPYGRRIAAGLLLCLLGDVLLEMGDATFLAGVGAFLCGHLAYITAFWSVDRAPRLPYALPFAAWGLVVFLSVLPGLRARGMEIPVGIYISVICIMMWRAAARWRPPISSTEVTAAAAGAILFGLSDTFIALDRFDTSVAGARYAIILIYWLGQLGITTSALLHATVARKETA